MLVLKYLRIFTLALMLMPVQSCSRVEYIQVQNQTDEIQRLSCWINNDEKQTIWSVTIMPHTTVRFYATDKRLSDAGISFPTITANLGLSCENLANAQTVVRPNAFSKMREENWTFSHSPITNDSKPRQEIILTSNDIILVMQPRNEQWVQIEVPTSLPANPSKRI